MDEVKRVGVEVMLYDVVENCDAVDAGGEFPDIGDIEIMDDLGKAEA